MAVIFTVEYAAGLGIKALAGSCPWDYSSSVYSIQGLIRLDYAPVWFATGLIFEKMYLYLQTVL